MHSDRLPLTLTTVSMLTAATIVACVDVGFEEVSGDTAAGGVRHASVRFGPEVHVSNHSEGGALRVEPSAAVHGETVVVAWNDSYGGRHGVDAGTSAAWSISRDGGRTFEFGGVVPPERSDLPPAGADTWLATDGEGRFYLQVLSWYGDRHALRLFTMDPARDTAWTERTPVDVSDRSRGEPSLDRPVTFVRLDGHLFVAYVRDGRLVVRASEDGGVSWLEPVEVTGEEEPRTRVPGIAALGETVLVCWTALEAMEGPAELRCAASRDGGLGFRTSRRLLRTERPLPAPSGYRIGPGPYFGGPDVVAVAADTASEVFHVVGTVPTADGSRILGRTIPLPRDGRRPFRSPEPTRRATR